ncbi:hypothetical protein GF354_01045 [Candidatus Peregrinibacteria bacterium]|nr:hypothetical protein [Candidatus Peregrinibacteria bacterium]
MMESKKLKIGLALGGGGVRGFVHLGIYEVLYEHKIPISCVSGTSMGAIIGGCIAMGYSPKITKEIALKYKELNLLSWKNFNFFKESLFKREELDKIFDTAFANATFKDTEIPFRCTSVNIETEEKVVHSKGLLKTAIAASSAYSPVFAPVFDEGRYLIDGGILDLVPVSSLRDLNVEKLIAVRLEHNLTKQFVSGQIYKKHYKKNQKPKKNKWYDVPLKFLQEKKQDVAFLIDIAVENASIAAGKISDIELEKAKPDLLFNPIVNIGLLDFSKMDEAIEIGRNIALKNLDEIKSWI